MCSSHGPVQLISRPTRITDSSATLIDHVYTNNVDNIKSCNILTVDLTDHLATHTKISVKTSGGTLSNLPIKKRTVLGDNINKKEFRIFNEANNSQFGTLINGKKLGGNMRRHECSIAVRQI